MPDRPGIVAAVGAFVADAGGNVVEADQHSDPAAACSCNASSSTSTRSSIRCSPGFAPLAERFSMEWSLHDLASRPRVAVLASRQGHCLADLLVRNALGELPGEIVLVASNHDTHAALVDRFDVPFRHVPVSGDGPEARDAQERELGALLDETAPDVVVLARYMRVLPAWLVEVVGTAHDQHPSLVPAVVRGRAPLRAGARARREGDRRDRALRDRRARRRTDHRPAGAAGLAPRRSRTGLERRGRDLEAVVLAEALRLHLEHRVIVYGRRTAVFD